MADYASSTVLDRELNFDTGHDPSGPRIRCLLCGWSLGKQDVWWCICGNEWNEFDTGGVCPRAFTNGRKLSASLAADGRRIWIDIPEEI
jgi:hypothetical protein